MTYKEKAIQAIELLIDKYTWLIKNGTWFFSWKSSLGRTKLLKKAQRDGKLDWFMYRGHYAPSRLCPLCKIYFNNDSFSCEVCC